MKSIELPAQKRETVGKSNAKALRLNGEVPAVIYSKGQAEHITVNVKALKPAIYTADTYIVNLVVDGKSNSTIIRSADFHPVTERLNHVEFLEFSENSPVNVDLPLKMVGVPKGVAKGGKITVKLRKISVKGIPTKLPEFIEVPVKDLDLGSTIKVGDVNFGDIDVQTPPFVGIASVEIPRSLRSTTAAGESGAGTPSPAGEEAVAEKE